MAKSSKPAKSVKKPGTGKKKDKKGLTTEELVRKHLDDPNHNISDEEFRDVQVDAEAGEQNAPEMEGGDERPHDVDKDHRFKTPWDVLDNS